MNWHYLYVFLQSNGLEVLFLIFFYGSFRKGRAHTWQQIVLVVTLCNSITHPSVVFFWTRGPWSYLTGILLAESFAIFAEVFLHRYALGFDYKKLLWGSLIANLISWQLGPLLTTYLFLQDKLQ